MSSSKAFFLVLLIIVGAVALRAFDITGRSLWFDEAFSWRLIHFPFQEMLTRDAQDVHPPLYYILLQGWSVVFGSSLLALRMFSVVCEAVALGGAYLFTSYAFRSRRAGFIALALLAVSGWNISYAWEARMYPLGMIFAFFSSYALLRAIREKRGFWFGVYALFAVGLAYTHYYGFFTIAAQAIFGIGTLLIQTRGRIGEIVYSKLCWYPLVATVFAILAYSPWLPIFLHQGKQVEASYWVPPIAITSIPDTFYQFFVPTKEIPPHHGLVLILSLMPIIGVAILWVWLLFRKHWERDGTIFTALLGLVPFLCGAFISFTGRSLYNDRFFAFAGIFVFCGIAYALSSVPKPVVRKVCIAVVIIGLCASFARYWNELDITHRPGGHAATAYIFTHKSDQDHVLVSSPYVYFAVLYYATEEFLAPSIPHLYSKTGELSHFSGAPITIQSDIVGSSDIASYTGTVWVVDTTGYTETPFEAPSSWKEVDKKIFPEVFVYQGDIIVRKFQVKK